MTILNFILRTPINLSRYKRWCFPPQVSIRYKIRHIRTAMTKRTRPLTSTELPGNQSPFITRCFLTKGSTTRTCYIHTYTNNRVPEVLMNTIHVDPMQQRLDSNFDNFALKTERMVGIFLQEALTGLTRPMCTIRDTHWVTSRSNRGLLGCNDV